MRGHIFPMWSYFCALVGPPKNNTHDLPATSRAPMSEPVICDFWSCSYGFMSLELKKLLAQMHVNSNLEMPPAVSVQFSQNVGTTCLDSIC